VGYPEPMPRRARKALIGAAGGVALLALTWYASHFVNFVERADVSILRGFAQLGRPRLDQVTRFIADLCDPKPYVLLATIPVLVALARRRPRVAATIGVIILGANESTQLLKPLLAEPRAISFQFAIAPGSWPSGHATAVMSLALCSVIAAPARRRPVVAAALAVFAIAVCYSFLELRWHYPSDVLGGFLVAATWTLLGAAGLWIYEARRPSRVRDRAAERAAPVAVGEALAPAAVVLVGAIVCAALIVLARPHEVVTYARAHEAFMVGAIAIGAVSLALASGLTLVLRRG
jgi:membrane-associated phospholipid phosphatase